MVVGGCRVRKPTLLCSTHLQLNQEQELLWSLPSTPTTTTTTTRHINLAVVRSEHVRTLFDSTQSQESESEVGVHSFYAAMRIKTHLDNTLYLSSLWSDLSK